MFKKFFLSFFVIGSFIAYSIHLKQEKADHPIISPSSLSTPTISPAPVISSEEDDGTRPRVSSPAISPSVTPSPMGSPKVAGAYKDGSYTGSVADAFYGNIQVKAEISGGKITDVIFLQYPNDRSTSIEINSQAMPYLKQEAIQAQSANVDIISGATDSSIAFRQSLQVALDQAKI